MSVVLLALSFAVILAGALLFTNAVEWIGHRLKVGEGAVGSILAAVGTAMPETLIAIVALLGSADGGSEDVAIGAIVGAPFLLGDAGDGAGRPLRLPLPRQTRPGAAARRPPADARARPDLLPRPLRARRAARLGRRRRRSGSRSASSSSSPTSSTSALHPARRRRGAERGVAQPADLRAPRRAPRRPRRSRSA